MKLKGNSYFLLAALVYTVLLLATSGSYNARARLIPQLIAVALIVMLVPLILHETVPSLRDRLNFVQERGLSFAQPSGEAEKGKTRDTQKENRHLVRLLAWFVGFTVLLKFVSYLFLIPVFLVLFIPLEGKQKWWVGLFVAVIVGIFDYLLFAVVLSSTF